MRGSHHWIVAASVALGLSLVTGTALAEVPTGPEGEASPTPRGTYVRVYDATLAEPRSIEGGAPAHILFLQRCTGGLDLMPGENSSINNTSSIVTGPVTLPEYPFGDESWDEVVLRTKGIFEPFNIDVTDEDPGDVPHDEAVVCGEGSDIGFGPGVGGVAPFTCGIILNPITFTFAESLGNSPQLIAEVIGQEAAHAWGLDHELLCEDPMTYLSGCGPKTFQDVDAQCGEFDPRPCMCEMETQNSYQIILGAFGPAIPDLQGPGITVTAPLTGTMYDAGSEFTVVAEIVDESEMDRAELYINGELHTVDTTEPWGWVVSDLPPGIATLEIVAFDEHGNESLSNPVSLLMGGEPLGATGGEDESGSGGPGGTAGSDPMDTDGNGLVAGNDDGCGCTQQGGDAPPAWAWASLLMVLGLRRRRQA